MAETQREAAEKDWAILRLRIENALLRFERRLSPGKEENSPPELS
jgi:hypothetical protein